MLHRQLQSQITLSVGTYRRRSDRVHPSAAEPILTAIILPTLHRATLLLSIARLSKLTNVNILMKVDPSRRTTEAWGIF